MVCWPYSSIFMSLIRPESWQYYFLRQEKTKKRKKKKRPSRRKLNLSLALLPPKSTLEQALWLIHHPMPLQIAGLMKRGQVGKWEERIERCWSSVNDLLQGVHLKLREWSTPIFFLDDKHRICFTFISIFHQNFPVKIILFVYLAV